MEIEILSHSNFPAIDPKRFGQMDTLVIYRVDKGRASSVMLTGNVTDLKAIERAVTEDAKKGGKIAGHKFIA